MGQAKRVDHQWTVAELLEFREAYGWSAEALAGATGYSRSALSNWKASGGLVPKKQSARLYALRLLCRTLVQASGHEPKAVGALVGSWAVDGDSARLKSILEPSAGIVLDALLEALTV